ncbi:MAG: murein hydrolase activator EnvC family protein [Anaerorhabdus sp.]
MKKLMKILMCMLFMLNFITPIVAEDDFDDNRTEYTILCSKPADELSEEEQETCSAFLQYITDESSDLKDQLDKLEDQRSEIAKDIASYGEKIRGYDGVISKLGAEIAEINKNISVTEATIRIKMDEITKKEVIVDALKQKVKDRMVSNQTSMRLNKYLDIIMGAKDLNDLIRRTNGLNDIANHDEASRIELQEMIETLNIEKKELETIKIALEEDKSVIKEKQDEITLLRAEANIAKQEALKQEADLMAKGDTMAADYEKLQDMADAISENLNEIPNSSGFTRPISGGRISAGTWHYPISFGGGVHLGADYAAPEGTTVRAVGNGYILKSADGCPAGYLGNSCGGAQGGTNYGGNQVYLLTKVNGVLYGVKYFHLLKGTPIAEGTIVDAGDKIGGIGTSGNSTGFHTHVEVVKLGTMSINEYIQSWRGDLGFGAGWGSSSLSNTCDKKSAPCRVKPESVFE